MTSTPPDSDPLAQIGVIGGSGFYSWLEDAVPVEVDTPFGRPSDPPVIGQVAGRSVAFLPRHGHDHRHPPHRVNYRANLWALRAVGVRQVLAPCAVGSLRADLGPGALVVPDQVIDRTWGRAHTIFDHDRTHDSTSDGAGAVVHVSFADPYCPRGRSVTAAAAAGAAGTGGAARAVAGSGTLVVINGPRFSSRAESRANAAAGADIVGMTGMPEASIARELALCYTCIAVVTDMDAGFDQGEGVTHADVMRTFTQSIDVLKSLLVTVVERLPLDNDCPCRRSLDGLFLPFPLP